MQELSDAEIIQAIKSGNKEKAISYLYKTCFPKIKNTLRARGAGNEDAKDIFQESVLKVYLKIMDNKLEVEGSNITGLLIQMAQFSWIDKLRKDKRIEFNHEVESVSKSGPEESSMLALLTAENSTLIERLLSAIGEKCKELLTLVIVYNFSMKEVADKLNFSGEDSAKSQHYKCRQKLISTYANNQQIKELLRTAP